MTAVHVVVPDSIDDPLRPSGGNAYDRQICDGLVQIGWTVVVHPVTGRWPSAQKSALEALAKVIRDIPSGGVLLVDGLIASAAPEVLVPEAGRLHTLVLMHMPLGEGPPSEELGNIQNQEKAVLTAVAGVITTSAWTQQRLVARYDLSPDVVHVARPGVAPAALATGTADGGQLLCVAALTPSKGHRVLLAALTQLTDLDWRLVCAGSLDRDPDCLQAFTRQARETGLAQHIQVTGPLSELGLDAAYLAADALVLPTLAETYGMVVSEALARGLPVIASDVGGVPEALGHTPDGRRPGMLVPPNDPTSLATALGCWLRDASLRHSLRDAARARRETLTGWSVTSASIARALIHVMA